MIKSNRLILLRRCLVKGDMSVKEDIATLESYLKASLDNKLEGSKIRSCYRWLEEGKVTSRYYISSNKHSDGVKVLKLSEMIKPLIFFRVKVPILRCKLGCSLTFLLNCLVRTGTCVRVILSCPRALRHLTAQTEIRCRDQIV